MNLINYKFGIIFTLISAFAYAVQAFMVDHANKVVSTPVIVFLETFIALLFMIAYIFIRDGKAGTKHFVSKNYTIHIKRTLFRIGISYFLFLSLRYIPVVNAVLLSNLAPVLMPFIAFIFFKRNFNLSLIPGILICFLGVIFIVSPVGSFSLLGSILAFLSSVCIAISMIYVRDASKYDSSETITLYYLIFGTIITGLISIPFWSTISIFALLFLVAIGFLFFIVQLTLSLALKYSSAVVVSSLYYSNIIFSALISVFVFNKLLSVSVILGLFLVILGGVSLTFLEKRLIIKNKKIIQ